MIKLFTLASGSIGLKVLLTTDCRLLPAVGYMETFGLVDSGNKYVCCCDRMRIDGAH